MGSPRHGGREAVSGRRQACLLRAVVLALAIAAADAGAADPEQGRGIYEMHCEICHGADGRGSVPGVPDFGRGQGLLAPDTSIARTLRGGVAGMPAYEGLLREQQLLDVIAYMRSFFR